MARENHTQPDRFQRGGTDPTFGLPCNLLGGRGEGGGGGDYSGGSRGASSSSSGGNNFDQRTPEPEPASAGSGPITDEDIPF